MDGHGVKLDEAKRSGESAKKPKDSAARAHTPAPGEDAVRVLMVAGGTGGHIFPLLAVAEQLEARAQSGGSVSRRYAIEFLGTTRQLESRLIPGAGYPLRTVTAAGLKGFGGWRFLENLFLLPRSAFETALVLRGCRPDVVVGIGGYLAGPALLEAAVKDIPTVLMELNAVPGFTNRALAPVVRVACVGFEVTAAYFGDKARRTGHPVRPGFHRVPSKEHRAPYTVLVVGGSQGSKALNECLMASLPMLEAESSRLRIIHQTGERDYNGVRKAYQERRITARIDAFIDDMPDAFAQADVVVSRAGATAVAELAAAGKAALLIPFPAATDQHQLENARTLERAAAARVIEQSQLTPQRLVTELRDLLGHPEGLAAMERHARNLARPDAAPRIAAIIEELAK